MSLKKKIVISQSSFSARLTKEYIDLVARTKACMKLTGVSTYRELQSCIPFVHHTTLFLILTCKTEKISLPTFVALRTWCEEVEKSQEEQE